MKDETFKEISIGWNHGKMDTKLKDLFYIDTDRGYHQGGIISFSLEEAKWLKDKLGSFIDQANEVNK